MPSELRPDLESESDLDSDSDFSELNSLLSSATAEAKEREAVKLAKSRIARGGPNLKEFDADRALVSSWQAKTEWKPSAIAAAFRETICLCGSRARIFTGLFTKETHRTLSHGATRYLPLPIGELTLFSHLPKETLLDIASVPICADCMAEKGWN
jgi:hypothetical protein